MTKPLLVCVCVCVWYYLFICRTGLDGLRIYDVMLAGQIFSDTFSLSLSLSLSL